MSVCPSVCPSHAGIESKLKRKQVGEILRPQNTTYLATRQFLPHALLVDAITLEPSEISSRNFRGNMIWSKARTSSKMAAFRCTAARG